MHPACFDSEGQFHGWREMARIAVPDGRGEIRKHLWCVDCTRKHQKSMMEQGRCAHPEVVFSNDEDGWAMGHVPYVEPAKRGKRGEIAMDFSNPISVTAWL
jgi:hypothetical protein